MFKYISTPIFESLENRSLVDPSSNMIESYITFSSLFITSLPNISPLTVEVFPTRHTAYYFRETGKKDGCELFSKHESNIQLGVKDDISGLSEHTPVIKLDSNDAAALQALITKQPNLKHPSPFHSKIEAILNHSSYQHAEYVHITVSGQGHFCGINAVIKSKDPETIIKHLQSLTQ